MADLQFKDIISLSNGRPRGVFMINESGVYWKPMSNEGGVKTVKINREEVKKFLWTPCGDYALLHVQGEREDKDLYERFDGFRRKDAEKFKEMVEGHYEGVPFEKTSLSSAGLNVGNLELDKKRKMLALKYDEKVSFELPLAKLKQCVAPGKGKNDIELQYDMEEGPREDEVLVQIKFYIPPDEENNEVAPQWADRITAAGGINTLGQGKNGDYFVRLGENTFLAPRGRYKISMGENHFDMNGDTYSYPIRYKNITRMFLLEKPDGQAYAFVISLANPIQQGQQRHKHLVLNLDSRDEEIELNISKEDLKSKFEDKISNPMVGKLPETVAKLFRVFTEKPVFVPGSYSSYYEAKAVKCALKGANMGLLYPLTKSFIFIHKPATVIRYEDIEYIQFQTHAVVGSTAVRSFELQVSVRSVGGEEAQMHTFSGIDKVELKSLLHFLQSRKIKIKNLKATRDEAEGRRPGEEAEQTALGDVEAESDDEDFESGDEQHSSDSSDSDISLVSDEGATKMAIAAKKKKQQKAMKEEHDEEEDGSEEDNEDGNHEKKRKRGDGEGKKKGPPKRDPKAPAPIKKAYTQFCTERREGLRKENPDAGVSQMNNLLGAEWKQLSEDAKAKFEKLEQEDKKRYEEEMASYQPSEGYNAEGILLSSVKESKKPKRDPAAPKQVRSAYQFYYSDKREEYKDMEFGAISTQASKDWKAASEEEKAKYNKLHEEDKIRFEKEKQAYTPGEGYDSDGDLKGSKKKKKKEEKVKPAKEVKKPKRDPDAPKKARPSYQIYTATRREELLKEDSSLSFGDLNKRIAADWKNINPKERAKIEKIHEEEVKQYEKEMKNYLPSDGYDEKGNLITESKVSSKKAKVKGTDSEKKKKAKEDKGPKQPVTAYNYFCQDQRPALKEKEPDLSFGDIAKKLAAMWKELDDKSKKKYEKLADGDKERYTKEKADFEKKGKAKVKKEVKEEEEENDDNGSESGSGSGSGSDDSDSESSGTESSSEGSDSSSEDDDDDDEKERQRKKAKKK